MAKTNEEIATTQRLAYAATKDYLKAKGVKQGLSKGFHAGAMVHALMELGLLAEEQKEDAFHVLMRLENGSALRQELEKDGTLAKANAISAEYI